MGFRLLLVMAMGLGAMYMVHLLAQDYNKIRQPVARALVTASSNLLNRGKRDASFGLKLNTTNKLTINKPDSAGTSIDWKRILSRDPFECLQSLICQLMSGAEHNSKEAVILMNYVESSLSIAPEKIGRAFSRGLTLQGKSELCYDEYPFCAYSAKTMMRVLRWFTDKK